MPNYYDDPPEADSEPMPPKPEDTQEQGSPQTAVVPKEVFGSEELKPGQVCKFKVSRVMDKEVLLTKLPYDQSDESSEDEEAPPEPEPAPAGAPGMYD